MHIAKVGARATILAPVAFMENLNFIKEQLAKSVYASALAPTRALAQVAAADIGAVAIRVLEDPGQFAGKRIDLAGDELSGNDAMNILSRITGRSLSYFQLPLDVVRQRWVRMPSKCTNGLTALVSRWIAMRFVVNSPMLLSKTLSLGRKNKIGLS
jgi:uncharacterized protein YbjT (DUF2867 family)